MIDDVSSLVIKHKNGKNLVFIPLDEYYALKETHYLLPRKNREMLVESIQEREGNKGVQKELMNSLKLIWSSRSWSDYLYWHKVAKNMVKRIDELIRRSMHTPFERIGTPEMLKGDLQGYWSRRITSEDRLIYKYADEHLFTAAFSYY